MKNNNDDIKKLILNEEADIKVDLDGSGEVEFETEREAIRKESFGDGSSSFIKKVSAYKKKQEDLTSDEMTVNTDLKPVLTTSIKKDAINLFSEALTHWRISKNSPKPLEVYKRAIGKEKEKIQGPARKSNKLYKMLHQASNSMMNSGKNAWDDKEDHPTFESEQYRGKQTEKLFPDLHKDAVTPAMFSCANLITKEECKEIFGDSTPDQIAYDIGRLVLTWSSPNPDNLVGEEIVKDVIGSEHFPENVRGSAAHYAYAIAEGFDKAWNSFLVSKRGPTSQMGNTFQSYIEEIINTDPTLNGMSEEEILECIINSEDIFDDFLYNKEVLKLILNDKTKINETLLNRLFEVQEKVKQFTDLMDKRWAEKYEKEGLKALQERFGHPCGLPTEILQEHHFLPGGYLVESGWIKVQNGEDFSFNVNFPVDKNGKPNPNTKAWENLNPTVILSNGNKLQRLGDLAEACASGIEAWHVAYNKGLPRDSLYSAAQLSVVDSNPAALSYDGYSGAVRGFFSDRLHGVEFAIGPNFRHLPTMHSKIVAISRKLASKTYCPRGVLSLKEIDLSNYRLVRFSDNQIGNEYGNQTLAKGASFYNFDKLDRKYHEDIQNQIRSHKIEDGMVTFAQSHEEFVRPLVGRQRGLAVRLFIERPGTYLRRTGFGGNKISGGVPEAVLGQMMRPLTPWSGFNDPVIGHVTDYNGPAQQKAGALSIHPQLVLAPASGDLYYNKAIPMGSISFQKVLSVASGRRGENFPRLLRFACRSLGEKATHSGLLMPNFGKNFKGLIQIDNIHEHLLEPAFISDETFDYSKKLTSAIWHSPLLYARDFELGEMGHYYKLEGEDEETRKTVLQAFLAGKQTSRQQILDFSINSFNSIQLGNLQPFDADLTFGEPELTEVQYGSEEEGRYLEKIKGHTTGGMNRFNCFFDAITGIFKFRPSDETSPKYLLSLGHDNEIREAYHPGWRGGYRFTGLENVPIKFFGVGPMHTRKAYKAWAKEVHNLGMKMDFFPVNLETLWEHTDNPDLGRDQYARYYKSYKRKSKLTHLDGVDNHLEISFPDDFFYPENIQRAFNEYHYFIYYIFVIYNEERLYREACGTKNLLRQDLWLAKENGMTHVLQTAKKDYYKTRTEYFDKKFHDIQNKNLYYQRRRYPSKMTG